MRKHPVIKKGQCLSCKRYFAPSVSSCVVAVNNVKNCPEYMVREPVLATPILATPIEAVKPSVKRKQPKVILTTPEVLEEHPVKELLDSEEKDDA